MEFITLKNKEQKLYTISNNLNNKYIIQFLTLYNLIISITNDVITFGVDSIEGLNDNIILADKFDTNFIYDIGCQLMFLKDNKLGVKYINPSDIVIINSTIFLFINPNMLFELLNKKHIKSNKLINSYEYGIVEKDSINLNSAFIAPEFKQEYDYIYYTSSFYSFGKVFQSIFNLNIDDIEATSLYYLLERCMEKNPENRIFLYV
jgi:hypothetical protein